MSAGLEVPERDPFEPKRALGTSGTLREFNVAGVLSAADVHVAVRLCELVGEEEEAVRLAVALAVRAPRLGHVFADLATIRDTAVVESSFEEPVDVAALPWPVDVEAWVFRVAGSELVAAGEATPDGDSDGAGAGAPLRLVGSRLYLDRYWREERAVAADLLTLGTGAPAVLDGSEDELDDGLLRFFPGEDDRRQREAAGAAVRRRFAVIAGGPGTGKTTTVARIVALLAERAAARGARPPLVALAAPTGKAAARLQEAVHSEAAVLPVDAAVRDLLVGLRASTLHRLLGWRPGSHSRFAHDRGNRLPHDVVIVDETSMVSLWLMARLVEAVRPDARLILVGDPGQLTSIEAGVVLGDIVGPAAFLDPVRTGPPGPTDAERSEAHNHARRLAAGIVVLERVHRYGGAIARVAEAIRRGDGDATVAALAGRQDGVTWLPVDVQEDDDLAPVRERAVAAGKDVFAAARAGAGREALEALGRFRLLCAHRRGPYGVSDWTSRMLGWLSAELDGLDADQRDYVGRPLLVTENDYELGLYNGDTGVIVGDRAEKGPDTGHFSAHPVAVFERGGELLRLSPLRLAAVDTVYAMTIHKSQGSQFDTAAVLLPSAESRLLTRELLYTAVTRARRELILVGTEEAVRHAVARPVARASGLRERLWGSFA